MYQAHHKGMAFYLCIKYTQGYGVSFVYKAHTKVGGCLSINTHKGRGFVCVSSTRKGRGFVCVSSTPHG